MPKKPATPRPAAEEEPIDWVTTAVHLHRDALELLRRVAVERANRHGGRPSVSAVVMDLVRANQAALEKEAER